MVKYRVNKNLLNLTIGDKTVKGGDFFKSPPLSKEFMQIVEKVWKKHPEWLEKIEKKPKVREEKKEK